MGSGAVLPPGCFTPGQITTELYRRAGGMNFHGPGYAYDHYGGFIPERGYEIYDNTPPWQRVDLDVEPIQTDYERRKESMDRVDENMRQMEEVNNALILKQLNYDI